jgi:outer membrane usher protein
MAKLSPFPCRLLPRAIEAAMIASASVAVAMPGASDAAPAMREPDGQAAATSRAVSPSAAPTGTVSAATPPTSAASNGAPPTAKPSTGTSPTSTASTGDHAPTMLILDVTINAESKGLAQFLLVDGALSATPATLARLGIRPDDAGASLIPLARLSGAAITFDEANQSLDLAVPLALLDTRLTQIDAQTDTATMATASPGMLINYDSYAAITGSTRSIDSLIEWRAFKRNMVVQTTALSHLAAQSGRWSHSIVRLDSSWTTSFPDQRLTLRVGDIVSVPAHWSRAVRLGGVQFGTNFALQPYFVTTPLPQMFGSAVMPSRADLYIDGQRRASHDLPAGPFSLGLPANGVDGSGRAQIVLTDILGRVTTIDYAFYETPRLLRRGVHDWSIDIGAVRRDYGLRSFAYARRPLASGIWRGGISNHLTVEAHGESDGRTSVLGAGGAWLIGQAAGIVIASAAASRDRSGNGHQFGLGYSWIGGRFSLAAETLRADSGYRDVAARWSGAPPRSSDTARLGYNAPGLGSLGVAYVHQRRDGQPGYRHASLYWTTSLGRSLSFSLMADRSLSGPRESSVFLTLNLLRRSGHYIGAGYSRRGDSNGATMTMQRSPNSGLGYRLNASLSDATVQAAGQVQYRGVAADVEAGVSGGRGPVAAFAGVRGALTLMGGQLFAARRVDDGFALVSTDGVADIPVRLQNRPVGRTNARGWLLVPQLNAYQRNQIAVDTTPLSTDLRIDTVSQDVVPSDRAGTLVRFAFRRTGGFIMTLVDAAGEQLPAGLPVSPDSGGSGDTLIVGYDGLFYIENPQPGARLTVTLPAGSAESCTFRLPPQPPHGIVRLGRVPCLSSAEPGNPQP